MWNKCQNIYVRFWQRSIYYNIINIFDEGRAEESRREQKREKQQKHKLHNTLESTLTLIFGFSLFKRIPKPSNSYSIIFRCVNGFIASKTIRIKWHVLATPMTCFPLKKRTKNEKWQKKNNKRTRRQSSPQKRKNNIFVRV